MLSFPKKSLEFIKTHLLRQQKEIEKNLEGIIEDDPAQSPVLAESSEPGTESYIADTHSRKIVLQRSLNDIKNGIKRSLQKIQKGDYGKCEKCNDQIAIGRLLAMPTAQYCVSCSQKGLKKK